MCLHKLIWVSVAFFLAVFPDLGFAAQAVAAKREVYVVPFSHLDLYWGGTREECLARGNDVIAKAINLAKQHPEFRFLLEDDIFVANYVDTHPGSPELEDLKRLVKDGRIEISPKWAGIYQNLPGGEALSRNMYYGKQYARSVFGVDPLTAHMGDLPGYTPQYPQILAKSGTKFMVMTRHAPNDKSLFHWRSPDGSRALVWSAMKMYGWGNLITTRTLSEEDRRKTLAADIAEVGATTNGPLFMTWGSDLYAPTTRVIEGVERLNRDFAAARFRFATPDEFFQDASKDPRIPETSGEIPSSWYNQQVSLVHVWTLHMPALNALVTAEKFAAVNHARGYAPYPQHELEHLWKKLLDSMDHNQDGQGELHCDERKIEYARMAIYRGADILRDALRNIAERVKSPVAKSHPIVVFNPMSWTRSDVLRTHVTLYGEMAPFEIEEYKKGLRLLDEAGNAVPFHVLSYIENISRGLELLFVARDVPPLGYRTYSLVPADATEKLPKASQIKLDTDNDRIDARRSVGSDVMENEFYRVGIERASGRVTLFDKSLGRDVLRNMEVAAIEDRGGHYIRVETPTGRILYNRVRRFEVEEDNGIRTVMRLTGEVSGVPVVQKLALYKGLKRLDIENTLEWRELQLMKIEQRFPLTHPKAQVQYGIPYGSNSAENVIPNAVPRGRDEGSMQSWLEGRLIHDWVFAGDQQWGLTISADHPVIMLGQDNYKDRSVLRAGMIKGTRYASTNLVRGDEVTSTQYPVPGVYTFRYSITSSAGDWRTARSYRAGMNFNNPLLPVSVVDTVSPKSLPPTDSLVSVPGDNIVISALKKAESGPAIVLRAFEILGSPAETSVEFLGRKREVRETNLLEEETGAPASTTVKMSPYEIKTVKIQLER